MSRKRVVITGLSTLTPLGNDLATSWKNLLDGKSGVGPITLFDASEFASRIAGELKDFDPEAFGIPFKTARRMDRFVQIAVSGGLEALTHSGYTITDTNAPKVGMIIGVGLGGLATIEVFHTKLMEAGPSRVSPFMIPMLISNMAPGQLSILSGAKGTNVVMTSACSSGLHAIGHAYSEILLDRCDMCVCGGVESTITPMGISGFTALKALSTRNDEPQRASRPFDKDRDGFVMAEGTGMLIMESLESAQARGATIYGEIVGFGASSDAYHMTAPHEDGQGLALAMQNALNEAGIEAKDVAHINAHGTSTQLNDLCETRAIKLVFGEHAKNVAICANKSQTGHLLGGAGGMEGVFTVMALHTGIVPGTINYETPDAECDLNYMSTGAKQLNPQYALCNSAGFGSTNASVLFKRWDNK